MIEFPKLNRFQITVLAISACAAIFMACIVLVPVDLNDTATRTVVIEPGQGLNAIARTLKSSGLIRTTWGFVLYTRAVGEQEHLQAGRYNFSPSMSIYRIVSMLVYGFAEPSDITIVIPEGENIWEIDQILTDAGLIKQGEFARTHIADEGYFFPDTYRFKPGSTVQEISQRMNWNFTSKVGPLADRNTVIVASLLEKEGKTAQEKALIAGIITERIRRGMALQIDASVAYGACLNKYLPQSSTMNCDVTKIPIAYEIGIDSEYNTYLRKGLPAGPISNPGLEAINAAQNPVASDYLYYLSPRDGTRIIFAKTAAEHARNRRKYLGL